jgi:hypothetical protein
MINYNCKNLKDIALIKYLNKYLHNKDISIKETLMELNTPM